MRVRDLVDAAELGLRVLTGEAELDRRIHRVMVTDLRSPSRFLAGGELVLTGLMWHRGSADSEHFVAELAAAKAAVLAAGEAEIDAIPADLVDACAHHRVPLLAVPEHVAFGTVAEYVGRRISAGLAADLTAVLDRHRALMAAPDGAGLAPVLEMLDTQLDLRCRVLAPSGREIAAPPGCPPLPEDAARDLARARLRGLAARPAPLGGDGGRGPSLRLHDADGAPHTALPVPDGDGRDGPGHTLAPARWASLRSWFLLAEGDAAEWTEERLRTVEGLARLVAVERERFADAAHARFRAADEAVAALAEGAPPAELRPALRAAGCELPPQAPAEEAGAAGRSGPDAPSWKVLAVSAHQNSPAVRHRGRRPDAPSDAPSPALLRRILDEALPGGAVGRRPGRSGVVALIPHDGPAGRCTGDRVRTLLGPLADGLADAEWLAVGISHPVASADALGGALDEAEQALGLAEATRHGRIRVSGPEETASHVTLLAAVPDPVRRAYRERLLGPLREHDARHAAGLVPTLEAFLDCDGSWTRCAARLNIHVNSVRYRIGRIEEITGRDLSRLPDRVDLLLALRIG